ncbi:unnamed protein product, partial [Vitrella brassicaformis CCMP3155]
RAAGHIRWVALVGCECPAALPSSALVAYVAGMNSTRLLPDEKLRTFKTTKCPLLARGRCNLGAQCNFSHTTEWTRRRVFYHNSSDAIKYCHVQCPDVQIDFRPEAILSNTSILSNTCKLGAKCPYSHSAEEIFYHPLFYKTRACPSYHSKGTYCKRPYCPFVHSRADRRIHRPDHQYKMYLKYHRNDGIELPPIEGVIRVEGPTKGSNDRQVSPIPRSATTRPNVPPPPPIALPIAHQPNDQLTRILDALRSLPETDCADVLHNLANVGHILEEATPASTHASPATPMSLADSELVPLESTARPPLVVSNIEEATAALHALSRYFEHADDQIIKALQPTILETALPIVLDSLSKHPIPEAGRTSSQGGFTPTPPPPPPPPLAALPSPTHIVTVPSPHDEVNSGRVQMGMGMGRGVGFTISSDLSTVVQASSSWSRSGSSAPSFCFPQAASDAAYSYRQASPTPHTTLTDRERHVALPRGLIDEEGGL